MRNFWLAPCVWRLLSTVLTEAENIERAHLQEGIKCRVVRTCKINKVREASQ